MKTRSSTPFSISVRAARAATVLTVSGELDIETAPIIERQLVAVLQKEDRRLVLDCSKLAFVDCYGLRPLIRAHNVLLPFGGQILIREPSRMFRQVLELTQLDRIFGIF